MHKDHFSHYARTGKVPRLVHMQSKEMEESRRSVLARSALSSVSTVRRAIPSLTVLRVSPWYVLLLCLYRIIDAE